MTEHNITRMQRLGYRKPAEVPEPDQLVLVDYVSEGRVAVMMDEHWRSVIHPDRVEGIKAFTENREPTFPDPEF